VWDQLDLRAVRQACRRRHDHALATAQPVDDLDVRPVVSPGLYYYEVNARAVVDDGDVYPRRVIDHSARGDTHDRMRYGDREDDVSVHAGKEFAGRILHLDLSGERSRCRVECSRRVRHGSREGPTRVLPDRDLCRDARVDAGRVRLGYLNDSTEWIGGLKLEERCSLRSAGVHEAPDIDEALGNGPRERRHDPVIGLAAKNAILHRDRVLKVRSMPACQSSPVKSPRHSDSPSYTSPRYKRHSEAPIPG
jgi:hypothetical protein